MSDAERPLTPDPELYDDHFIDPRERSLMEGGGFSYYLTQAALESTYPETGAVEPVQEVPRRASGRATPRRRGGYVRDYTGDEADFVPAYAERSPEEIQAQKTTNEDGMALVWDTLDSMSARRLGISVEAARQLRLQRRDRENRSRQN